MNTQSLKDKAIGKLTKAFFTNERGMMGANSYIDPGTKLKYLESFINEVVDDTVRETKIDMANQFNIKMASRRVTSQTVWEVLSELTEE